MKRHQRTRSAAKNGSPHAHGLWAARDVWIALALFGLTAGLFSPALRCKFIDYDDNHYVTHNTRVQQGLSPELVGWTLRNPVAGNWHPLTVLSHAADCQFYGLNPAGHHATSVALHALNAALAFVLLRNATGRTWSSAVVAALFAWHPLRVESVAWIAERKDVLSTAFGLSALLAYTAFTRKRGVVRYLIVVLLVAAALMSKPMMVTLPCVMLLWDFWPLGRWPASVDSRKTATIGKLFVEKLPFFVVAVALCVITLRVQAEVGAVRGTLAFPWDHRVLNAVLAYAKYVGQTVWPWPLAVLYPLQGKQLDLFQAAAAALGLATVTIWVVMAAKRRPYLLVGWLWFVGTLVPVIGLVQVGEQAHADRYTYWPHLGLFVAVVWLLAEWLEAPHTTTENADVARHTAASSRHRVFAIGAVLSLIALSGVTLAQLRNWRDTETLFRHALAITSHNYIAHLSLGNALMGQAQEAAVRRESYVRDERVAEAAAQYEAGLKIQPAYFKLQQNLGNARFLQGRLEDAAAHFALAERNGPPDAKCRHNLGEVLSRLRRYDESAEQYESALRLSPGMFEPTVGLAIVRTHQGNMPEAVRLLRDALHNHPRDPRLPLAQQQLARVLASAPGPSIRDVAEALRLATSAAASTRYANPLAVDALGIALAANGRFAEARGAAERAHALALRQQYLDRSEDWNALADRIAERIGLFARRQEYLLPATAEEDR